MSIDYEALAAVEPFLVGALALFHLSGVVSGVHALFSARSPQGAIAWVMSMVTMPYVAVPLYWVFGRDRFVGYVAARRAGNVEIDSLKRELDSHPGQAPELPLPLAVLEKLAATPFTTGNAVRLLVNGQTTFDAIFAAMAAARHYVLVQFYIIRDDGLGRMLKSACLDAAGRGVRVCLLYDEIGSHALPETYIRELARAGVDIKPFNTTKGWRNRFQLNFRNHRKIVVVDGSTAFVGGHNVGDEYLGLSRRFGPWRDTHVAITGPAVAMVQLCFLEDWYFARQDLPELNWNLDDAPAGSMPVLALPSGPADTVDTFSLALVELVNAARHRLWIVSPYFVPGPDVTSALHLAALRGVDVRVMLPLKPDHKLVYLASFSYFPELESKGVKFYRYRPGFLHQKVVLVDFDLACVGTANCDNRSFRLNFELTIAVADKQFAVAVEQMLAADFTHCGRATAADYTERWLGFKAAVRLARLLSPIL